MLDVDICLTRLNHPLSVQICAENTSSSKRMCEHMRTHARTCVRCKNENSQNRNRQFFSRSFCLQCFFAPSSLSYRSNKVTDWLHACMHVIGLAGLLYRTWWSYYNCSTIYSGQIRRWCNERKKERSLRRSCWSKWSRCCRSRVVLCPADLL